MAKRCSSNSIDLIDIKILEYFINLPEGKKTTWEITKRLYPLEINTRLDREHKLTIRRMEKMEKMGLFIIESNSPRRFILISENIKFKKIKCPNNKIADFVWLNIYNKWMARELPLTY